MRTYIISYFFFAQKFQEKTWTHFRVSNFPSRLRESHQPPWFLPSRRSSEKTGSLAANNKPAAISKRNG
jgi:hypothetical protein